MERAAATVKRVSMELGGNAPFIVFDDANLEAAADAVVGSGFMNSGQVCIAANRVLVHVRHCHLVLAPVRLANSCFMFCTKTQPETLGSCRHMGQQLHLLGLPRVFMACQQLLPSLGSGIHWWLRHCAGKCARQVRRRAGRPRQEHPPGQRP